MAVASKALVVKLSSLGDLFHALPAVHRLKRELQLSIDWVTQPEYVELVSCFDDVDRVLAFPRNRFFRSFPTWLTELRAESYDYVLDFQGLFKSGLVTRLARAGNRIGPSHHREGAGLFYREVAGVRYKDRHAVDEALDFVRHMGLSAGKADFPVTFPERSVHGPGPHIAYLPCSRWATKNWPPEHFASLIRTMNERVGGTAYLFGGRTDASVCARIAADAGVPLANRCGQTSLIELGGYLKAMDMVVTVDSGPMHMAAASGVPVLAVFGSTDPTRTGPYGERHRVVRHGELSCQPCRSRICLRPERDIACMRDLRPERVAESAVALLRVDGDRST